MRVPQRKCNEKRNVDSRDKHNIGDLFTFFIVTYSEQDRS